MVAFGGGSALDAGKAIAALAANGGDPLDYLEVIGRGSALDEPSLPLVAIPTTAGTGSEVTRNAVLGVKDQQVKASLRSPHMLPRLALVDPELLAGAPPAVLASSGLDALSQLLEPFLSARANPLTDALAREGIDRSARSLAPRGAGRRRRGGARGPGARQPVRRPLPGQRRPGRRARLRRPGGRHVRRAPRRRLRGPAPRQLAVNLRALRARAPSHPALPRFQELAVPLTGRADAQAEEGVAWGGSCARPWAYRVSAATA